MILIIVLSIAAVSLTVMSAVGIVSMAKIKEKSENALTEQAMTNLSEVIDKKTAVADLRFRRYKEMVASLIHFVDEINQNRDKYQPLDVQFADPANAGKLVMQPVLANENVKWDDVKEEAGILANAADHFEALMTVNKDIISSIFFGVKDGFILSYDDRSHLKPLDSIIFNYFDTEWYKLVEKKQEICFTDVYEDIFGRGLVVTCAGPIHDKNGSFCGVLGIDLLINDLYSEVMDADFGDDADILVLGTKGNIISLDDKSETHSLDKITGNREVMNKRSSGIIALENRYYAFGTVETVQWKLCISVPQSHVIKLAETIGRDITNTIIIHALLMLIILAIVIILIMNFTKKITKPLTDLTDDIGEMSKGNLDHRAQIGQGSTETAELADSFNVMADSLKEHIAKVTAFTAEKERITAELNVAAKMQADILPRDFPRRDDIELFASMTPAKEMGGDFYDFFMVDEDRIALVIADVSGKGVPAALFMVEAKTLIKTHTTPACKPSQIMRNVNNALCADNPAGLFVTAWLGILSLSSGELISSNAGHEQPAVMHENGKYELIEVENMPPLAAVEDIEYIDETVQLQKGDRLFLYTDGVPEAKAPDRTRFGIGKMLDVLNINNGSAPDSLLKAMKQEIDSFTSTNEPFDDVTMMNIIWHGEK